MQSLELKGCMIRSWIDLFAVFVGQIYKGRGIIIPNCVILIVSECVVTKLLAGLGHVLIVCLFVRRVSVEWASSVKVKSCSRVPMM